MDGDESSDEGSSGSYSYTVKLIMTYKPDQSQVVVVEIAQNTPFREALEEFVSEIGFRQGIEEFWMDWPEREHELDPDETPEDVGMADGTHHVWVDDLPDEGVDDDEDSD